MLRYWETEFETLNPVKRRGNRRYYQHHDVLKVREIRDLLYHQGYTIGGARLRLEGHSKVEAQKAVATLQIKQLRGDLEELLRVLS